VDYDLLPDTHPANPYVCVGVTILSDSNVDQPAPPADSRGAAMHSRIIRILTGEFARSGYVSAVDQGIISLVNFLAAIVLARNISLTAFGVYGVGFTILRLGRAIQEGLIIQPFNTFGASIDSLSFKRYASTSLVLQLLLALVTSSGVAAVGYTLTITGNDTAGPMIFGLWFSFFVTQIQEFLRRLFYTREQTILALLNTILSNTVRMIFLFWTLRQGTISALAGLNAIGWGALAGIVLGVWNGRSYWTRHLQNIREIVVRDLEFGRWVLGGVLANFVSVEFYPVITAGMISFAASGAYRAIQNLLAPVLTLLRATDTFFVPRMAKIFSAHGKRALNRPLKMIYFFTGLPTIGWLLFVSLFASPLLNWVYGEKYAAFAVGVPLMAIFYFLWYLYWPVLIALKAARISRPMFVANGLAIALMFSTGLWMIKEWGVYGTITGQILNALVVGIVLWAAWIRANGRHVIS
jgi:O-antigen/teichoic acid export membrane protein